MTKELRDTPGLALIAIGHCQGEDRMIKRRGLPPIQRRMGVEDLEAAHQEDEQTDCIGPVCHPDHDRMPADDSGLLDHGRFPSSHRESYTEPGLRNGGQTNTIM